MRPGRLALTAALVAALGAPLTPATAAPAGHHPPATIDVAAPNHFPEAVDWDARHRRFLVGSAGFGTISGVGLDGTISTLVSDPRLGPSVIGIRVDGRHGRVLATGLATDNSRSGVGSYDLATGRPNWYVDLAALAGDGGPHFTNDVAVDADGVAYVVDGVAPLVYRIDRQGRASVLVRDDRLGPNGSLPGFQPKFGLVTVAALDGFLIVAKSDRTLWRIPLDRPARLSRVSVTGTLGDFVDGARVFPGGDLGVVSNGWFGATPSAQRLRLSPDGRRATVVTTRPLADPLPTGISPGPDGTTYVLSGRLDLAFTGRPSEGFSLHTVRL